jgi:hypothetical protein
VEKNVKILSLAIVRDLWAKIRKLFAPVGSMLARSLPMVLEIHLQLAYADCFLPHGR